MHIAIFGNTNNYPYLLAAGFHELGCTTTLIVNQRELLHRPESKTPAFAGGYPDWIHDCSGLSENDFISMSPSLCDTLNTLTAGAHGVVLNHIGPSLSRFVSAPSIALLTGSDLTYYANYNSQHVREEPWETGFKRSVGARLARMRWIEFVERQRDGILTARAVSFPWPGMIAEGDKLLDEIGVTAGQRFFVCMADTRMKSGQRRAARRRLRLLNGARLNWITPLPSGFSSQDGKGTDVLLKGFSRFIANGGDAELRLIRKGLHVKETEALVRTLGLQDSVVWLDEMSLTSFYEEMQQADVVCDQFALAVFGMVAVDAMALGKPVLGNFRVDITQSRYPDALPVCNASTPDEVASHLQALSESSDYRIEVGLAAQAFAKKWFSPAANAKRCLELLGLHTA